MASCRYTVTARHEEPRVYTTLKAARAAATRMGKDTILRRKCTGGSGSRILATCKRGSCRTVNYNPSLSGVKKRRKSKKRR